MRGHAREALDAWKTQVAILSGVIEPPEEPERLPVEHTSIADAVKTFLTEVKATKSDGTYDAYRSDLDWFRARIERNHVGKVTRSDIMKLFARGREEGLAQASINRRVDGRSDDAAERWWRHQAQEGGLAEDIAG